MFSFHPYGLMISLGLLVGVVVAWWRKKLYGISENDLENLFLLVVPFGIIGARLYHVLDKWSYYSENPAQIIAVWNGGLGIYGAVFGGLVGLWIFTKNQKDNPKVKSKNLKPETYNLITILDFLMPSLAIGQAIARWGNFFNHEVFGPPTNLPWGWFIPVNLRPEMWKNFSYFQPTFAYESLWVLIGFFILLIIERKMFFSLLVQRKEPKESTPCASSQEKLTSQCHPERSRRIFLKSSLLSEIPRLTSFARNDNIKKLSVLLGRLRKRGPKEITADFTKGTQYKPGLLVGFYAVWYGAGRFAFEFLRFDTAEINGIKTAQIISLVLIIVGLRLMYIAAHGRGI